MNRFPFAAWFRSIKAQLLLWAILPVALLLAGLSFAGIYAHQQDMHAFVSERDAALARAYARMVASWHQSGAIRPDGSDLHARVARIQQSSPSMLVLDASGTVLSHPDVSRIGLQFPGYSTLAADLAQGRETMVIECEDAGAMLFAVAPVGESGWILALYEPAHAGISPTLRYSSFGPVVIAVTAVITLLLLTLGWRTIANPLRKLADAAQQVDWALDMPAVDLPPGSVIEVVSLRRALTAMIERIKSYQAGLRDYLNAVTQGQEAERARLARDIHDGTLQEIISLSQRAEMARRLVERGETARATLLLTEMRESGIETIEELRRILGDLRPTYLEDLGFLPALTTLVERANERGPAHVRLEHDGSLKRLPIAVELAAYRIAQEALNNALQHAHASEIVVRLECQEQGLSLTVSDNGVGFVLPSPLDLLAQHKHFGLISIRERVAQVGGYLWVESHPGDGTKIRVSLPGCASQATDPGCMNAE